MPPIVELQTTTRKPQILTQDLHATLAMVRREIWRLGRHLTPVHAARFQRYAFQLDAHIVGAFVLLRCDKTE